MSRGTEAERQLAARARDRANERRDDRAYRDADLLAKLATTIVELADAVDAWEATQ